MIARVAVLWLFLAALAGLLTAMPLRLCPRPAFDAAANARRIARIPVTRLLSAPPRELVDASRQREAACVDGYGRANALLAMAAMLLAALAWLWLGWHRALERLLPGAPRFVRYGCVGALLAAWLWLWGLPFDVAGLVAARGLGLSHETAATFLRDEAASAALTAVLGAIFAQGLGVLWRRGWSVILASAALPLFVIGAIVVPLWIAPIFNAYRPLPPSPLRAAIEQEARRAGFTGAQIYETNLSAQSEEANAFVFGFWKTERIVLGDTLLRGYSREEILFVLAHEIGHAVHGDVYRGVAWGWLFTAVGLALTELVEPRRLRALPPESRAPALLAIALALSVAVQPLANAISRGVEHRADAYALTLDHDRAAGVRTFVRLTDEGLAQLCPPRWAVIAFGTHPPLGSRIAFFQGSRDPCR